jgi:anti-anti-sigma regulatory factor
MKQVEDFDGAGLQFLMAGREFAAQQNCGFAVSKPGPEVVDALQAMGLSNMIGE